MQKLVFTNGGGQSIDLTSGNFGITNWEGFSGAELNIQTQQVPFQDGGVFLDALIEQREVSVTVAIQDNNNLSLRYELKRQLISALNPKLGEGVLVYTNDYLSRQIKAVPQLPIFENKNSNDAGTLKASVVFSCPSPYWEDLEETSVELNLGQEVTIDNQGDIPTQVEIILGAGLTDPSVKNITTDKMIKLNGYFENETVINTRVGQKSVYSQKTGYDVEGGSASTCVFAEADMILTGGYYPLLIQENKITSLRQADSNFSSIRNYLKKDDLYIAYTTQRIWTSQDGKNWTQIYYEATQRFRQILIDGSQYVAVGNSGLVSVSTDLINWEDKTTGSSANLYSIIKTATGVYVVGGVGGTILTSSNLTSWTARTSGTDKDITKLFINENYEKILAFAGTDICSSANGTSWSATDNGLSKELYNCIYKDNYYVAVGNGIIAKSADGTSWESIFTKEGFSLNGITYGANQYCVVGDGAYIKSTNLSDWEIVFAVPYIDTILYDEESELYFATTCRSIQTKEVYYTKNIFNWNVKEFESNVYEICIGGGKFVVRAGSYIFVSEDECLTWAEKSNPQNYEVIAVAYDGEQFLLSTTSLNPRRYYKTNDFVNYTQLTLPPRTNGELRYFNGYYVIVRTNAHQDTNNAGILVSTDLTNWTLSNVPTSISRVEDIITYIPWKEKFYAYCVGTNTRKRYILSTSDFIDWEIKYYQEYDSIRDIKYNQDRIFVYTLDRIISSVDGESWSMSDISPSYNFFTSINIGDNTFMFFQILAQYKLVQTDNIISKLTTTSDMSFNLKKGENKIKLNSEAGCSSAILKYRQKYIGV